MILRLHRHLHACVECGREFFICSQRDCDLAPEVCAGCEQDRMDDYFNELYLSTLEQKDTTCPTSMTHSQAPISKPRI